MLNFLIIMSGLLIVSNLSTIISFLRGDHKDRELKEAIMYANQEGFPYSYKSLTEDQKRIFYDDYIRILEHNTIGVYSMKSFCNEWSFSKVRTIYTLIKILLEKKHNILMDFSIERNKYRDYEFTFQIQPPELKEEPEPSKEPVVSEKTEPDTKVRVETLEKEESLNSEENLLREAEQEVERILKE